MADNSHDNYGSNPAGHYAVIAVLAIVFILFLLFSVPLAIGVMKGTG